MPRARLGHRARPGSARCSSELANRARITRRPFDSDPALALHAPGVQLDAGRQRRRSATPADLDGQRVRRAAAAAHHGDRRAAQRRRRSAAKLLDLADRVWDHLAPRRLDAGTGRNLWDQPAAVFGQLDDQLRRSRPGTTPSAWCRAWSPRPTCCSRPPLRSERLGRLRARPAHRGRAPLRHGAAAPAPARRGPRMQRDAAASRGSTCSGPGRSCTDRPGTAAALASTVLRGARRAGRRPSRRDARRADRC